MAVRKSAKKKAARKKAAKKRPKKQPLMKSKKKPLLKRPRASHTKMGTVVFKSTIPGLVKRIPELKVIVITPTGIEARGKARRGDLVAFENHTSVPVTVTIDDFWPFDLPKRDILVPAGDRSGWYYIPSTATIGAFSATITNLDGSAYGGPPGDPILDVDG